MMNTQDQMLFTCDRPADEHHEAVL